MKSLNDLKETLFQTIDDVREGNMDVDKAKMVNELAKTINDQARIVTRAAEVFRDVDNGGLFQKPEKSIESSE